MLFLLFGSSASGKTTLVHDVAGRVDRVVGHDFDEIGVPAKWAEWMRNHARDPQWMQHVIRIPETEGEMCWGRRIAWRVHTIDTSKLGRDAAVAELSRWVESERAAHSGS